MGDLYSSPSERERMELSPRSDHSHSPVFLPNELTIRLATRDETVASRTSTYSAWGKGKMSLDQYLRRDDVMEGIPASNNGKLNTWILVVRDNPRHPFLASCETYRRESLVVRARDTTGIPVISFGIASVFTPEKYRRNGYARLLLRLLNYVLAPPSRLPPFPTDVLGSPPVIPPGYRFGEALFSVLYSDVGGHFYSACGPSPESPGWDVRDPWSAIWNVSDDPVDLQRSRSFKWLDYDDLEGYVGADRWRVMAEDLPASAAAASSPHLFHIATPPSFAQVSFLISRYVLSLPRPPTAMHWGAAHTSPSGEMSYMTWVPEPHENATLLISRLRCDNPTSFEILLSAAFHVARQHGLKRVEVWNSMDWAGSPRDPLPLGGRWVERSEHLPSLAWYGEGKKDDVVWHLNERFAWC